MIVVDNGDKIRGDAENAAEVDYLIQGLVGTAATQLADGQLPAAIGDLYTSGADAIVITSIILVNTGAAAQAVNLYLTPNAGTARRLIPKDLSLGIGYSLTFDGQRVVVMNAAGSILYTTGAHAASHQNGGADEISVAGLSGELADDQPPKAHASDHTDGTDDVADLVGDSGAGGTHGLVPAPGAGDAAANKFLKADATWATAGEAATKELFVPWLAYVAGGAVTTKGYFVGIEADSVAEQVRLIFYVPHDFASLTSAVAVFIPNTTATHRVNIYCNYGANGEAYNTHSESSEDVDMSLTANQIYEFDLSGVLTSLAAGDYVGITMAGDSTNIWDVIGIGLRLRYS